MWWDSGGEGGGGAEGPTVTVLEERLFSPTSLSAQRLPPSHCKTPKSKPSNLPKNAQTVGTESFLRWCGLKQNDNVYTSCVVPTHTTKRCFYLGFRRAPALSSCEKIPQLELPQRGSCNGTLPRWGSSEGTFRRKSPAEAPSPSPPSADEEAEAINFNRPGDCVECCALSITTALALPPSTR